MTEPTSEHHELLYGQQLIRYTLRYDERKTLAIRLHPDLSVVVIAPLDTPQEEIAARVHKRAAWILRKQRQYERYLPHLPARQYVSGETHRYLGRQYRLKVVEGEETGVTLERLFLVVTVPDKRDRDAVREMLDAWYRQRAEDVFAERLSVCWLRVEPLGVAYPRLTIRAMSTRWGSAGTSGRVRLNLKLIQVPRGFIDYVLYHELCHLVEPHHGPAYYALLERVLPDWWKRRDGLNEYEFG